MARIRLNQEYRNKIANRMRVHLKQEPTVEKQKYDDLKAEQIELNERINPELYSEIEDPEIRRKRFLEFELALRQESAEAIDSLNWKWWKKDPLQWMG